MKKILIVLLLLLAQVGMGQSMRIDLPDDIATKSYVRAYVDSVLNAKPTLPKPNDPVLLPCAEGPNVVRISDITEVSLQAQFHGQDVFGIDWQITNSTGVVRSGSIKPTSSILEIGYQRLPSGNYTLKLFGNTCQGKGTKEFKVKEKEPTPPVVLPDGQATHDLFMNLTGYGYDLNDPTGVDKDWRERIEAFKYSWGYGITGIRLCVRWYDWEPTQGNYTRQKMQDVIAYCKARNLKLAIFFWPWRKEGDGFIPADAIIRGHRGTEFSLEGDKRMGSLASDIVNKKLHAAIAELSATLATYEGGHSIAIGTASAEEFINPVIGIGEIEHPEITGFEPVFQEGFRKFLASKNRPYQRPEIVEWPRGVGLQMSNEIGKDYARFVSLSLTRYFQNFSEAIRKGGKGRILATYMYPDAGNPQNAWYLHSNFRAQAASADIMYGTDGNWPYDIDRKLLCNAIAQGMGKLSIVEYDPTDLGQPNGYCSGVDLGLMEREFEKSFQQGVHVVAYAMSYCPAEIRAMEPHLKPLHDKYIGKAYNRPNWPTTVVPIAENFFRGQEIYKPYWTGNNWLLPDDTDFWGSGGR